MKAKMKKMKKKRKQNESKNKTCIIAFESIPFDSESHRSNRNRPDQCFLEFCFRREVPIPWELVFLVIISYLLFVPKGLAQVLPRLFPEKSSGKGQATFLIKYA